MKRKSTKAKTIISKAKRAFARGACLVAGQLIDKAYRSVGRGRVPHTLRVLDDAFERTCVRKHPKR